MDKLGGDLMTVPEVAKKLGLLRSTVYSMIHRDILPGFKIGKCVRIRPEKLAEFVAEQEKKAYGKAA